MAHQRESHETEASPIEIFFASYSDFAYNPSQPSAEQFQSMRRSYGWRRGDAEGESAWEGFRLALVKEFNWLFGTDEHDLLAWQNVCAFVGVPGRFETSNECIRFEKPTVQSSQLDRYPSSRKRSRSSISHQGSIAGAHQTDSQLLSLRSSKGGPPPAATPPKEPRQIIISNASKSSFFPPSSPTRDGRAKAKKRKNDMLPVSPKSKGRHRMIAESIEAAGAL